MLERDASMTKSDPIPFEIPGHQAVAMTVVRNDGHCWGHVTVAGTNYIVESDADLYDLDDSAAASKYIEAVCANRAVFLPGSAASIHAQRKLQRLRRYGSHRTKVAVRRIGELTTIEALAAVRSALLAREPVLEHSYRVRPESIF